MEQAAPAPPAQTQPTPEQAAAGGISAPMAPTKIEDTGLDQAFLINLFAKGMFLENLEEIGQITQAIKLPDNIVSAIGQEMVERKLIYAVGSSGAGAGATVRYQLTKDGQQLAQDACNQNLYFGPAPVRLEQYQARIRSQSITGERISKEDIAKAFADIVVPDEFISRLGPAINSGHSILIYGPAGNGKTTMAEKVAAIFESVIYVPYCFEIDGAIVKVFDPAIHKVVEAAGDGEPARPHPAPLQERPPLGSLPAPRGGDGGRVDLGNAGSALQRTGEILRGAPACEGFERHLHNRRFWPPEG